MSLAKKITFAAAVVATGGFLGYLQTKRVNERKRIQREKERQQRRRAAEIKLMRQQVEMARKMRQKQASSNSPEQ